MPAPNAIIAGAGIGGLTAALCLQRAGFDVRVFEQADVIHEVGAGIQLSPNAMRVLDALGVSTSLQRHAVEPEWLEMRDGRSGRSLFCVPANSRMRWGAPYWHVHRADLIDALQQALARATPDALRTGRTVTGYRNVEDGVMVLTADTAPLAADLLIGADGIHSAVRQQMHGDEQPRFTGNVAWRMTVPIDRLGAVAPAASATVWRGAGRHAVTYRLRAGTLGNLVGVVEHSEWRSESWTAQGTRDEALADFAGWHPTVTSIIAQADAHYRWALFDRPPLPHWHDGHVALLGDACHPMLPFMAQGAAMAIEDAWALGAAVSGAADVPAALARYTAGRLPRTTDVQSRARRNQSVFHASGTAHGAIEAVGMRVLDRVMPGRLAAQLDWIYGYDVCREIPLPQATGTT